MCVTYKFLRNKASKMPRSRRSPQNAESIKKNNKKKNKLKYPKENINQKKLG
jgi:hypothetical protein